MKRIKDDKAMKAPGGRAANKKPWSLLNN